MKKILSVIFLSILLITGATDSIYAQSETAIPEEKLLPRLTDEADILSDTEEEKLLKNLDEVSERQKCDVVIATVASLNGQSPMNYADDFYDYNGYGYGKNRDGILLLISMENRDCWISTYGYGMTAFTDAGLAYIQDQFLSDLSDGNYFESFTTFAELCDSFITQARTEKPYDTGNLPRTPLFPFFIAADFLIGFVIALILAFVKKGKLKSVRPETQAQNYTVPGSLFLSVNQDWFINKTITTRKIQQENPSGSSTHSSSSGTTHGGSGGKF